MRIVLLVLLAGCSVSHAVSIDAALVDAHARDTDDPDATVPDAARPDASLGEPHWELPASAIACTGHTATLLAGGDVLVVGDCIVDGAVVSALRYDAVARTARRIDLIEPRHAHAAVALDDGGALVIAGFSSTDEALATTEVFDAIADAFTSGPVLIEARAGHAALRSGSRVIVVGGARSTDSWDSRLASVEAIDLAGDAVMALPSLRSPRDRMVLLERAGEILVVGGLDDEGRNATVETLGSGAREALPVDCPSPSAAASGLEVACSGVVLDLSAGVRTSATLLHSRLEPAVARFVDGSLFVIGSSPWTNDPPAFPERVMAGTSTDLPSPGQTYLWPTATMLNDETVLVIGENGAQLFVPRGE